MLRFLTFAMVFGLLAGHAAAAGPTAVDLGPIDHAPATLVVVSPDGTQRVYSPAELEEFPTYRLVTTTPWRPREAQFEGVLLRDVLTAGGLGAASGILMTAENDYIAVIPRALWDEAPILLATRVNGHPLTTRERGPILVVMEDAAYRAHPLAGPGMLVWMVAKIEAAP